MDSLVVKMQRDITGTKVLLTEVPCGTLLRECDGMEATMIADRYGIAPMGKTFADAEVDESGLLHLGDEVEAP